MKLVLRQGSYENETLISGSATEQDIQSALLSIDPTKSFELVADDGATIQTAQSEENLRYWVNLTEVSRFGKKHCQGIDGQLGDLRDVIRAFNYFLNNNPKLGDDFKWAKTESEEEYQVRSNAEMELSLSILDPELADEFRKRQIRWQSMTIEEIDQEMDAHRAIHEQNMAEHEKLIAKIKEDSENSIRESNERCEEEMRKLEKLNPAAAEKLRRVFEGSPDDIQHYVDESYAESLQELERLNNLKSELENAYSPSALSVFSHGLVNEKILCPQCSQKGYVHVQKVNKKAGVSGGKATAALLTAGLSLFVAGLSRSEKMTEAFCGNCESQWYF